MLPEDRERVLDEPPVVMDAHALEAFILIYPTVLLKRRGHARNQENGARAQVAHHFDHQ